MRTRPVALAAVIAFAGAVTAAAVTAGNGGGDLVKLPVSAAGSGGAAEDAVASSACPAPLTYPAPARVEYRLAGELRALSSTAPAYRLGAAASRAGVARLAQALGLSGDVGEDEHGWFVGDGDRELRVQKVAGLPWYMGSACPDAVVSSSVDGESVTVQACRATPSKWSGPTAALARPVPGRRRRARRGAPPETPAARTRRPRRRPPATPPRRLLARPTRRPPATPPRRRRRASPSRRRCPSRCRRPTRAGPARRPPDPSGGGAGGSRPVHPARRGRRGARRGGRVLHLAGPGRATGGRPQRRRVAGHRLHWPRRPVAGRPPVPHTPPAPVVLTVTGARLALLPLEATLVPVYVFELDGGGEAPPVPAVTDEWLDNPGSVQR